MTREVLYLGPFNPEEIVRRRKLPARNPAAYNRMIRLAKALTRGGAEAHIVSTGVSLRIGLFKQILHRQQNLVVDGIRVSVLPALGVPVVGFLAEPLFLLAWLFARFAFHRSSAMLVYNATVTSALAVMLASLFRIPVIYEVEDVPTWAVTTGARSAEKPRLFQNLSWLIAARVQRPFCSRVLVPSRRFLDALNLKEADGRLAVVVSGCMDVEASAARIESYVSDRRPLKVLFAGKLEAEHGYDLLLGAIDELRREDELLSRFEFHVCGLPRKEDKQFEQPKFPNVFFHGFVTDSRYKNLLGDCDIGLALQKSAGLFQQTRTPSKAYEFLASGKLLIATNVGDLGDLFPHSAICLDLETSSQLAELLRHISRSPVDFVPVAQHGLDLAKKQFSFQTVGQALAAMVNLA
ncbi:MAG TPA: glycosyltransferase [Bryobacteraceae bacterium]|nr:glycosyltransferase [Bryobacteraceae bacterium]